MSRTRIALTRGKPPVDDPSTTWAISDDEEDDGVAVAITLVNRLAAELQRVQDQLDAATNVVEAYAARRFAYEWIASKRFPEPARVVNAESGEFVTYTVVDATSTFVLTDDVRSAVATILGDETVNEHHRFDPNLVRRLPALSNNDADVLAAAVAAMGSAFVRIVKPS